MFCPKCKRRYLKGETICPVDSVPLVHTATPRDSGEALRDDDDDDVTHPKFQGQTPSVFSKNRQNLPTEISPPDQHDSGATRQDISLPIDIRGPKILTIDEDMDDEELKTTLDAPPMINDDSHSPAPPQTGPLQDVAPDEGAAPVAKSVPEAFAHTMQAVDQNVREALAPGIKKRKSEDLIGQELHGTYRLNRLISEGPMSNVFEASHLRLTKKRLAIKMLNPSMETRPDAYARFRREAEIATELGHPHIVDVLDFNITEDGHLYLVMEYLEGEDLAKKLEHPDPMGFAEICPILGQVGSGLQAAHDHGIIHRDMKPGNIFLVASTENMITTKILDFGISKIKHSESVVTHYNMSIGTPFYMSPEQARATKESVDHTTDVFALGTIAYQMLTGVNPFFASTLPKILDRVSNHTPTPVTQLQPRATAEVDRITSKALQKRKENRYQRIEHFTNDLIGALHKIEPLSPEMLRNLLPDQATGDHDFYVPLALEKDPSGVKRPRRLIGPTRPIPLYNFERPKDAGGQGKPADVLFPPETAEPAATLSPLEKPGEPTAIVAEETAHGSRPNSVHTKVSTAPAESVEAQENPSVFDTIPLLTPPVFTILEPTRKKGFDELPATLHDSSQLEQPIDLAATPEELHPLPEGHPCKLVATELSPEPTPNTTPLELAPPFETRTVTPLPRTPSSPRPRQITPQDPPRPNRPPERPSPT